MTSLCGSIDVDLEVAGRGRARVRHQDLAVGQRHRRAVARGRAGPAGRRPGVEHAQRREVRGVAAALLERADAAVEHAERAAAARRHRRAVGVEVGQDQQEVAVAALADVGRRGVADRRLRLGEIGQVGVRRRRALREQRVVVGAVPVDAAARQLVEAVAHLLGGHRDPALAHEVRGDLGVRQERDLLVGALVHGGAVDRDPPQIGLRQEPLARPGGAGARLAAGRREHDLVAVGRERGSKLWTLRPKLSATGGVTCTQGPPLSLIR